MLKKFFLFLLILVLDWHFNLNPVYSRTVGTNQENSTMSSARSAIAPYLQRVQENITEFTLDNNIKFIVLENHQAPIISFVTYVDVGGVNEPVGKTGVAHFLEHLAFKGTKNIGTIDYEKESVILDKIDQVFEQIKQAQRENNPQKLKTLEEEFNQLNNQAQSFAKQNEFGQIVEVMGGVGLNASTSADATIYYYNFPSNKLELWMYLESERYLNPVFREFNEEKQVILEERKLRVDNSPIGKMVEVFLNTAFTTHPYQHPVIGYQEDILNLTRDDVKNFFQEYYGGSNITIAMAGDVNPQQVKTMAEKYFGRFPNTVKPASLNTVEPPQNETRNVTLKYPSQPLYLEGYHIPNINDPDYIIYGIISSILSDGRTSRLQQSLVEKQKVALAVAGFNGFPGDKYPNLMMFYGVSAPETDLSQLEKALHGEIEKLTRDFVTDEELDRVKTQAQGNLLYTLSGNAGMAKLLAEYQSKTNDWRNLFLSLDKISSITKEDILRVAQKTFIPENKTIGKLETISN